MRRRPVCVHSTSSLSDHPTPSFTVPGGCKRGGLTQDHHQHSSGSDKELKSLLYWPRPSGRGLHRLSGGFHSTSQVPHNRYLLHNSTLSPPKVYFHPRSQEPPWFFASMTSAVLLQLAMLCSYWSLGGEWGLALLHPTSPHFPAVGPHFGLSEVAPLPTMSGVNSVWGSLASEPLTWWVGSILVTP